MENKNNIQISVIVPLYKGKKYVDGIIRNIENCVGQAKVLAELIFVNDYPKETIVGHDYYNSKLLQVKILENETNLGIHKSRLKGLECSCGSMIHFLDQDDYVDDNFYLSQLSQIGTNDAVISLVYQGEQKYYKNYDLLDNYISIEWLIKNGNMIISPGQVILKKSSIPRKWKQDTLKYNGADDYYLWMCMIHEGRKMVFNTATFFHHVLIPGINATENLEEMLCSIQEVFWKCKNEYFGEYELELCWEREIRNIKRRQKINKEMEVFEKWMMIKDFKQDVSTYLLDKGYNIVSIYGLGKFGKHLYYEIKDNIEIEYLFDQKVEKIGDREVVDYMKNPVKNRIIVLSIIGENSDIQECLRNDGNVVIKLENIILNLSRYLTVK